MAGDWSILSFLIWLPILGGAAVALFCDQRPMLARVLALVVSIVTFLVSISLYWSFDTSTALCMYCCSSSSS